MVEVQLTYTDTFAARSYFDMYAVPRLNQALSQLEIETDNNKLQKHIKALLNSLHDLHIGTLTGQKVESFESEFGFRKAEDLELTDGIPLLLLPYYLLDGSDRITVAIGRIVGNWEKSSFRQDLGDQIAVQQFPIIGFSRNSTDGLPPLIDTPYNIQSHTTLYSVSRYGSRLPFVQ